MVPAGVLYRRLYSASAIALAFALYGAAAVSPRPSEPAATVGATAAAGCAVRARRLFACVRPLPDGATLRQVAARAATTLAAYAPASGGLPIESAAFIGATHVS